MNTKNNQRFQNNENKIQTALMEMLEKQKDFQNITVQQICAVAKINRSTFYAHFLDIRDLTEKCEMQFRAVLRGKLEKSYGESEQSFSEQLQLQFLQFIKNHINFYRLYFLQHSYDSSTIPNGPNQVWLSKDIEDEPAKAEQYRCAFYQAGITAILEKWVKGGCNTSPQRIQSILCQHLPEKL